jgi:DNA-binding NarL/FixJ family response regulator
MARYGRSCSPPGTTEVYLEARSGLHVADTTSIVLEVRSVDKSVRVAIVDDDLWIRSGRSEALAKVESLEVVATLDHGAALADPDLWSSVDVAVVDAWDRNAGFDRFPGVTVVEAIRRVRSRTETVIVVISGHVLNDMLRLRMAEAGADYFYGHDDVSDVRHLSQAVIRARDGHGHDIESARLDAATALGGARPNAALSWIEERSMQGAFSGESQKALPVSRRTIMRMRRELGNLSQSQPVSNSGSQAPLTSPSWRQIRRFIDRARGAVSESESGG